MRSFFRYFVLALALVPGAARAAGQGPLTDPTSALGVSWSITPATPCVNQDVQFLLAQLDSATTVLSLESPDSAHVVARLLIDEEHVGQTPGTSPPVVVDLGRFAYPVAHEVVVLLQATHKLSDSTSYYEEQSFLFGFNVSATCPPDSGLGLPYVTGIRIGSPSPCDTCRPVVCAGASYPVLVRGVLPDDCLSFDGLRLEPSAYEGPTPQPPIVVVRLSSNDCLGRPCAVNPVPFEASIMLPALLAGDYRQPFAVQLTRYHCTDPPDSSVIGTATLPFTVAVNCDTTFKACLYDDWVRENYSPCDTYVSRDQPAQATFAIRSTVALAGLQGSFQLDPAGLRITRLEPVGPAVGMHLDWSETSDGARFVLFADSGAPIPAMDPSNSSTPVLQVTVAQAADVIAPTTFLRDTDLLGSDVDGQAVPMCPNLSLLVRDVRICAERPCDFDGNGATDVRDLVLMAHCVLGTGPCPDSSSLARFDCDGNGVVALEDVLCCAHTILLGAMPDSAATRSAPGVAVTLGAPAAEGSGLAVPVTLHGADEIGAAKLDVRFPDDRYEVASVDYPSATRWLALHEVRGGEVVIGLVGLGGGSEAPSEATCTLHLALRSGARAGGEIEVSGGEFSAPDGVGLKVDLGHPTLVIGGGPVALSPALPNPFGATMRFSVTLAAPGPLEVAVFDLNGRRVATLHRGSATAGSHEFTWDGRDSAGDRVANGIYFYRATSHAGSATRKVTLLRE